MYDTPAKDAYTESNDEKTLDKLKLRDILQSNSCNLPKCQSHENQEKNSKDGKLSTLKETKDMKFKCKVLDSIFLI